MRRISILSTSLVTSSAMLLTALAASPANGGPAPTDVSHECLTGVPTTNDTPLGTPTYTVTTDESVVTVDNAGACTGDVVIPEGVTAIGSFAFDGSQLISITIPASVTSIKGAAFQEVTTLTTISFSGSSNLETIEGNAFFGATGLTSVVIPDGVTSIGENAFYGTSSLISVTFDGNDTSPPLNIGNGAFYFATKLTSISIPKNVTSIGKNAFDTTTSLTSVTFAEGSLLTSIGNSAFAYASLLASITIPANVGSIGTNAFEEADSLSSIYFLGHEPSTDDTAFFGISSGAKAYIKFGKEGYFLDQVTGKWKGLEVVRLANEIVDVPVVTPISPSATSKTVSIKLPKFYTSSSRLTKAQKTALKNLVAKSGTKATFVIAATAGKLPGVSDSAINALAKKRGKIAKAYLVKLGISKSQIKIKVKITNQGIVPKTKILTQYLTS